MDRHGSWYWRKNMALSWAGGRLVVELHDGQPAVEPGRDPPGPLAEAPEEGGNQEHADHGGVEQDGDGEGDAELRRGDGAGDPEGDEHHDHHKGGVRDRPAGAG